MKGLRISPAVINIRIADIIQDKCWLLTADGTDRKCAAESHGRLNFSLPHIFVLLVEQSCQVVSFRVRTCICNVFRSFTKADRSHLSAVITIELC